MSPLRWRAGDRVVVLPDPSTPVPRQHYGTVAGVLDGDGPVAVGLDGPGGGTVLVAPTRLRVLDVTAIRLVVTAAADILADPALRRGLVALWQAELRAAGLTVDAVHLMGDGKVVSGGTWALAEVLTGGTGLVLTVAVTAGTVDEAVVVAAPPNRWD